MNILLVGSGGREHALAWKLAQSPRLEKLFILPGNPGTAEHGHNLPGSPADHPFVIEKASQHNVDLVVIGPEVPLAEGLADDLAVAGIPVFGPSRGAAQIESSKAFSKAFMQRHGIPAAASQTFQQFEAARAHLRGQNVKDFVLKASGLAAGKGVYLPQSMEEAEAVLHSLLVEGSLGEAGQEVLVEERLEGREVSVLAFTDGQEMVLMPPVQDHKRLLDGDRGPNTGGMGTYAPSPACRGDLLDEIESAILRPTIAGLREEGLPFVGVLYAGLMLTPQGPRVLEFNCRFGDPETQVLMPLLDCDLLEVVEACAAGNLSSVAPAVRWRQAAAVCVVLAAPGYPDKLQTGSPIRGLEKLVSKPDLMVFHAGTAQKDGQVVTAGGRVLGITGLGPSLEEAAQAAYRGAAQVNFEGMQFRKDIGKQSQADGRNTLAYAAAGVSIEAGNQAVELMKESVRATFTPDVLSDVGAFGGLYDAGVLKGMDEPVLVASTDGVGTKVDLAARAGLYEGLGHDIVNHCINDILVQGARPLFFLDYYACSELEPARAAEVVRGISQACQAAGCALLGGETAEMPGVYAQGRFDIAGTIVGVVERRRILPRPGIRPGDVLVGLASNGPHTNGYSLIRRIFEGTPLDLSYPEIEGSLAQALLAPHRSYLPVLSPVLFGRHPDRPALIQALAHITGGGFFDNLPRVLPEGCGVRLDRHSWPIPPLFQLIQSTGQVEEAEMYHVFNMGIGMVAIVHAQEVETVRQALGEKTWVIGEVIEGGGVHLA